MATTLSAPRIMGPDGFPSERVEVLFIGDEPSIAELYRLKLELDGYWVTLALTLADGLERLHQRTPDLVFLDLGVGSGVGLDALQTLRSDPSTRDIPIVHLWRGGETALAIKVLQLGPSDFVVKADLVRTHDFSHDHSHSGAVR